MDAAYSARQDKNYTIYPQAGGKMPHVVTSDNYLEVVENSSELVLLHVWASWCVPCKIIEPLVEQVVDQNNLKLAKLDVEAQPELASRIGIGGLPTVRLFHKGKIVFESVGTLNRGRLEAAVGALV